MVKYYEQEVERMAVLAILSTFSSSHQEPQKVERLVQVRHADDEVKLDASHASC